MTTANGEPIWVECEGGGCPGNGITDSIRGCQMCGQTFHLHPSGVIPPHQRDDILARIGRGDFG